jgi:hypothetical protein
MGVQKDQESFAKFTTIGAYIIEFPISVLNKLCQKFQ